MDYLKIIQLFLKENNFPQISDEKNVLKLIGEQFFFRSGKSTLLALPEELGRGLQYEKDELVFFAGTFDPFHLGHQECLSKCPRRNIIVMPDLNPWKEDQKRVDSKLNTYLKLLTDTMHCVYPGFLGLEKSNPTVDWITKVNVKRKYLLMGADIFMALEDWKEPEKLLSALDGLYILSRKVDYEEISILEQKLSDKYKNLKIEFIDKNPYEDLSSTDIRSE
jgi:nicotinate-nucleotide adenylyltransferase